MTTNEIIFLVIANFVLLNISFYFFAIGFAAHRVHYHTLMRHSKEQFSRENPQLEGPQVEMDRIGMEWMQQHSDRKWDVHIQRDGINLYGEYFDFGYDRAVFILSGRTDTLRYGYYFAIPYAKAGYNVLVADPRAHGHSDGKYLTLGHEESKDDLEWARFLHDELGNRQVLFHGICIGAAAGMLAITDDNCPDYIAGLVAEGMFSRFSASMKNHLIERKKNIWPVMWFINLWMRRACGYDMNFGPIDCIHKMNKPLLMLHSNLDPYSTVDNAIKLYQKCPSPHKQLVLFEEGGHSLLRITDTQLYDSSITAFVNRHFPATQAQSVPCNTAQVCGAEPQPPVTARQVVDRLSEQAFPVALAATIIASLPTVATLLIQRYNITLPALENVGIAVLPVIAAASVILGDNALRTVNRARDIAEPNGLRGGGKYMAARILSKVGALVGVTTAVYWLTQFLQWLWPYLSAII
ncbi:MAG: alpha/beta hydrolase [Clostridia bacterium]|nr:alpha/beta hydrolase [Clostridia bacterium]